jgi:hypothetical protein
LPLGAVVFLAVAIFAFPLCFTGLKKRGWLG